MGALLSLPSFWGGLFWGSKGKGERLDKHGQEEKTVGRKKKRKEEMLLMEQT
jgi:hypothetical protein